MTRVLVTGAAGFTGSNLVKRLVADGVTVRGLVRNGRGTQWMNDLGVEPSVGDLRDPDSLADAAAGVEIVYHIAAEFRRGKATRGELWETNVEGTRNVIRAAEDAGVSRFVHCSTVGVYGDVKQPPADEASAFHPGDDYQESKLAAEEVVREAMQSGPMTLVVARPAGIYGPGDTRFLKLFRSIRRRRFVMVGSGKTLYQLVYIDDLAEGFVRCAAHSTPNGSDYILAGDEIVTLNELVGMIAEILEVPAPRARVPFKPVYWASTLMEYASKPFGISPPLYRRRVDFFRKNRAFSIEKAERELDFHPQVDLRTGLRATAEWYAAQGLL